MMSYIDMIAFMLAKVPLLGEICLFPSPKMVCAVVID